MAGANGGHVTSYGADPYTDRFREVVRGLFGDHAETFPVFNGTGANVLSLQASIPRWGAVVCAASAHINTDENGAPERVAGIKLLTVDAPGGKLTPELIDRQAWGFGDEHRAQPAVVSLTQSTELGTVYSLEELRAVCDHAHSLGLKVHMDGARLSNGCAALGVGLREATTDAGVDIVSLGGTKNGLLGAEAIVVLDPTIRGLDYLRKMDMQLASKMRFVSAQLLALFEGDLWLRSAGHANDMAARLAAGVRDLPGVQITQPVEANAVFVVLEPGVADRLRKTFAFYDWDHARGEVRWVCSFDTTEGDVAAMADALRRAVSR
nr:beta-eliminating lyase-related protein [Acidiferrimicrobium sp. IK]